VRKRGEKHPNYGESTPGAKGSLHAEPRGKATGEYGRLAFHNSRHQRLISQRCKKHERVALILSIGENREKE